MRAYYVVWVYIYSDIGYFARMAVAARMTNTEYGGVH